MSREIKFRAWHPTSGMAMTPILQRSDYTGVVRCKGYDKDGNLIFLPLMQCTGYKDKNGAEIYEGDFIKVVCDGEEESAFIQQVTWEDEGYWVDVYDCEYSRTSLSGGANNHYYEYEVIGNIHENPELVAPAQPA